MLSSRTIMLTIYMISNRTIIATTRLDTQFGREVRAIAGAAVRLRLNKGCGFRPASLRSGTLRFPANFLVPQSIVV
jgi:hypothetical protein